MFIIFNVTQKVNTKSIHLSNLGNIKHINNLKAFFFIQKREKSIKMLISKERETYFIAHTMHF